MTSQDIKGLYDKSKRSVLRVCVVYVFVALIIHPLNILPKESVIAAGAIGILIALELLISVDDSVKSLQLPPVVYPNQSEVVGKLISLMQESGRSDHSLKIIAASGGSIKVEVLPAILNATAAKIDIKIQLVDAAHVHFTRCPAECPGTPLPAHWEGEIELTIRFLKLILQRHGKVTATCKKYAHVPCLRGIMLNNEHLFLGGYVREGSELWGAPQPHHYYRRHGEHEAHFKLFESWFEHTEATSQDVLTAVQR